MTIQTGSSTSAVFSNSNDTYILTETGSLVISNSNAVFVAGTVNNYTFAGDVYVDGLVGIRLDTTATGDTHNHFTVTDTGSIVVGAPSAIGFYLQNGDNASVTNYGSIVVNGSAASGIYAHGSHNSEIKNFGTITAESFGIRLIGSGTEIVNGGSITSNFYGVDVGGAFTSLNNSGFIYGNDTGLRITETGTGITNSGEISSQAHGVRIHGGGGGTMVNTGEINGTANGVRVDASALELNIMKVVNHGTISGGFRSYSASVELARQDIVHNSGNMVGDIQLGTGDDTYRAFGTGHVVGSIDAGLDDDVLHGGNQNDTFIGNGGSDILRGSGGEDDLFGGNGQDTLQGGTGDDNLIGGQNADTLRGQKGDDDLNGGSSNDILIGGQGEDTLKGGSGSDTFVFNRVSGHDTITDFEDGVDQIDLSQFGFRNNQYTTDVETALSNAGSGNTLLDLAKMGGNGSVVIEGLAFSNVDSTDFIL